jgi:ABC-type bacteriocin/lantibiotic exporter with double-glycine peptidase domain
MAAAPQHIIRRLLSMAGITISPSLLKEKLQAHPDYPSLLAVTDTLDELGIDNAALQIDKERINEVPTPFLAHDAAKGEFVVINNVQQQLSPGSELEKNWNGMAQLAEKPKGWHHTENEKRLAEEKKSV